MKFSRRPFLRPAGSFLLAGLIYFHLGCGGPGERMKDLDAQAPAANPTPGEREISGTFKVSGSTANDKDPYEGLLTVAPSGTVYSFRWTLNRANRIGTGVQFDSAVGVSFAATGAGKGCGTILYKRSADGALDGRIVRWGDEKFSTEKAVQTEGTSLVGRYSVTGTDADGKDYSGTLEIKKDGGGYQFLWMIDRPRVAFGTWNGSFAAASFGGRPCGFALFDVQSNGNMDGTWGGQASVTIGKETVRRQ